MIDDPTCAPVAVAVSRVAWLSGRYSTFYEAKINIMCVHVLSSLLLKVKKNISDSKKNNTKHRRTQKTL